MIDYLPEAIFIFAFLLIGVTLLVGTFNRWRWLINPSPERWWYYPPSTLKRLFGFTPDSLTIIDGKFRMDGGSVFLDVVDNLGRRHRIFLLWSIDAIREGRTSLRIDGCPIAKRGTEEDKWVSLIAAAAIAPEATTQSGSERISPNRIVFAKDAQAVLEAAERSPLAFLSSIRDSLVEKIRSPIHDHKRK